MKKYLFLILFLGFTSSVSNWNAQSIKEPSFGQQKADDGGLTVYPNPTKDVLFLKTKDQSLRVKSVTFYSILGMPVAMYNVNMNAAEINVEKLRPGKYLMKYTLSDNTTKIKQIIKQ